MWGASYVFGMLLYPVCVVVSVICGIDSAAKILGDMAGVYFIAVAGIVAAFFGAQALSKTPLLILSYSSFPKYEVPSPRRPSLVSEKFCLLSRACDELGLASSAAKFAFFFLVVGRLVA